MVKHRNFTISKVPVMFLKSEGQFCRFTAHDNRVAARKIFEGFKAHEKVVTEAMPVDETNYDRDNVQEEIMPKAMSMKI